MTSLEYYIEQIEQFISALTDDIESGEGTVVTQTKLAVYQEVLEHLEEIEQEPCEDAISRQAVLDEISDYNNDLDYTTNELYDRVKRMSSVTPQPKTGHWIKDDITERSKSAYKHKCDRCGAYHRAMYDYCPSCGAKMVEPQESNDKCKNCEYYRNPDYTRCHECEADKEQKDNGFFDEIMGDESDGEVYEKIKEIINEVKEQEE